MFGSVTREATTTAERLDGLVMSEQALRLEMLDEITRLDSTETWKSDGATSMADWLVGRYTMSIGTAREWIRVAGMLEVCPRIREVYSDGGLSWDQLRALVRVADTDNEAGWAERAPHMTVAQLRAASKRVRTEEVIDAHERRRVEWWFDDHQPLFRMTVHMADVEGATLATWLTRRAGQYDPDPQSGVYEPFETRCADALYELASQALTDDRDHDRATILVRTNLETLLSGIGTATVDDGPALSSDTLRRLACDARLQLALTGTHDTVVGVGVPRAPFLPGWSGSFEPATMVAGSLCAGVPAGPTPTTSSTGPRAAPPTSTTSSHCVDIITGSSTNTAGPSPATPTTPSPGIAPTATRSHPNRRPAHYNNGNTPSPPLHPYNHPNG